MANMSQSLGTNLNVVTLLVEFRRILRVPDVVATMTTKPVSLVHVRHNLRLQCKLAAGDLTQQRRCSLVQPDPSLIDCRLTPSHHCVPCSESWIHLAQGSTACGGIEAATSNLHFQRRPHTSGKLVARATVTKAVVNTRASAQTTARLRKTAGSILST